MKILTQLLVATALFGAAAPAFAATTVPIAPGTGNADNCFPFTCSYNGTYQQVFSSSAFTGPQAFDTLTFFANGSASGVTSTGNYAINLYYSSKAADGLSSVFANNRGALIGSLGLFSLSGQPLNSSSPLSFTGALINYNPSLGNLLLNVSATTAVSGNLQMDAHRASDTTSRVFGFNSVSGITDTSGLVTQFSLSSVGAVPEPSTWLMMLLGFGFIGGALRSAKRNQKVTVSYA